MLFDVGLSVVQAENIEQDAKCDGHFGLASIQPRLYLSTSRTVCFSAELLKSDDSVGS